MYSPIFYSFVTITREVPKIQTILIDTNQSLTGQSSVQHDLNHERKNETCVVLFFNVDYKFVLIIRLLLTNILSVNVFICRSSAPKLYLLT